MESSVDTRRHANNGLRRFDDGSLDPGEALGDQAFNKSDRHLHDLLVGADHLVAHGHDSLQTRLR
jgi:hypothetical protein